MDAELINTFLQKVNFTEQEEISCSDCFEQVSGYIERTSVGMERTEDAQLRQHLFQCDVCREEAEVLLELFQQGEKEDVTAK